MSCPETGISYSQMRDELANVNLNIFESLIRNYPISQLLYAYKVALNEEMFELCVYFKKECERRNVK